MADPNGVEASIMPLAPADGQPRVRATVKLAARGMASPRPNDLATALIYGERRRRAAAPEGEETLARW